ncbi:terminase small subunit [Aggregatibacter actinomycetemcomitans]|uniref:terminase small subunit n=1 Tax=Aggregatibacter actinomycetemcomitans TaxID=714 RepID=UPI001E43B163|nr:terminase small subunit [Aggregatibacter actinomycetemcomitans]
MSKKDEVKSTSGRGESKLRDKQKRFIEEYLIDLNATQAAIRAGYSKDTAKEIGYENLTKPHIQQAIAEAQNKRAERTQLTQDEVIADLRELRDICMGRKPVRVTEVVKNNQEGTARPVQVEIFALEPTGAGKALDLLGKHLGMFSQKVEVSGDLHIEQRTELNLSGLDINELEQLEKLLEKGNSEQDSD